MTAFSSSAVSVSTAERDLNEDAPRWTASDAVREAMHGEAAATFQGTRARIQEGMGRPATHRVAGRTTAHAGGVTSISASTTRSTSLYEWNRWVEMRSGDEKVPGAAFCVGSLRRLCGTELLRTTMS